MKKILYLLLLVTFCFSCGNGNGSHQGKRKKVAKSLKVKCYKQRNPNTASDNNPMNDYIFWYLIMNNNGSCSYYSSPTPITNYSTVNWSKSDIVPQELNDKENVQEQPEQEVEVDNLSNEMQAEIDATPDNFEGMTFEELGDYENSTQDIDNNSNTESNSNSESNSSSSSESSSGGESGGGDGGGGDGGGGGE